MAKSKKGGRKQTAGVANAYKLVAPEPPSDEYETDVRWQSVSRRGGAADAKASFLTGKHTAATRDVLHVPRYDYNWAAQQTQQAHDVRATLLPPLLPPPLSPGRALSSSSLPYAPLSLTSCSLPAAAASTMTMTATTSTTAATPALTTTTPAVATTSSSSSSSTAAATTAAANATHTASTRAPAVDVYVAAERALLQARATASEATHALTDMTELRAAEAAAASQTRAQLQHELAALLQRLASARDGGHATAVARAADAVCADQQHHLAHVYELLVQDERYERAFNERAAAHERCARVTAAYFREHSQHVTKMERLQRETAEMHERMLTGMTQTLQRTADELTCAFARRSAAPATGGVTCSTAVADATGEQQQQHGYNSGGSAAAAQHKRSPSRGLSSSSSLSLSCSSSSSSLLQLRQQSRTSTSTHNNNNNNNNDDDPSLLVRELVLLERQSEDCIGRRDATQRSIAALRRQMDVEVQKLLLARARQAQLQRQVHTLTTRVQHAAQQQQQQQPHMATTTLAVVAHDKDDDKDNTCSTATNSAEGGDGAALLAAEAQRLQAVTHELQELNAQLQRLQQQRMRQLRGCDGDDDKDSDSGAATDTTAAATATTTTAATTTTRMATDKEKAAASAARHGVSVVPSSRAQLLDADTRALLRTTIAQALCEVDALLQHSKGGDVGGAITSAAEASAEASAASSLSRLFALTSLTERKAVQNYVARKVNHALAHQYPTLAAPNTYTHVASRH